MKRHRTTSHGLLGLLALAAGCASSATPDGGGDDAVSVDALEDRVAPEDTVAPDVPAADVLLPAGTTCTRDAQCETGLCVQDPNLAHVCGVACRTQDDCSAMAADVYCALDRAPGGARLACAHIGLDATGVEGDACASERNCAANVCVNGVCHEGCAADAACTTGSRCVDQSVAGGTVRMCGWAAITGTTVEDTVVFDESVSVDRGPERRLVVAPDAVSLTLVAHDRGGAELYAAVPRLVAPDGMYWIDSATWNGITDQPVRELIGNHQINSVLAPSSDTLRVLPGPYRAVYALYNDSSAGTRVTTRAARGLLRVKRAPGGMLAATGALRLRLYFVGVPGINAGSAPTNATLQSAVRAMNTIYGQVGVTVSVDGYADVTGADATTYGVIDSSDEMDQLLTRSAASAGDVLNVFFVRSISATAGLEGALGVAGDIVGPPGIHGTIHSGVVVAWESTAMFGANVLPQTLSHECGHYLGLWHNRERDPGCTTMLAAGCSPYHGVDPISDSHTGTESSYLMYWSTRDGSNTRLSRGEGVVMRSSVLVR